jgi:tripartite-type tricarboxylate transporter receptor subunit TctC
MVEAGQLKALATTSGKRSKFYPNLPTVSESGLPGYEAVGWFGLLAPANTPVAIVDKLNKAIVGAMDAKEFKDQLAMLGAEPEPQTPAEFGRFINADLAKWIKLVKEADIKMPGGN